MAPLGAETGVDDDRNDRLLDPRQQHDGYGNEDEREADAAQQGEPDREPLVPSDGAEKARDLKYARYQRALRESEERKGKKRPTREVAETMTPEELAQALAEIDTTVSRATQLANQMLALAKVEQLRGQTDAPVRDWAEAVRAGEIGRAHV